jgi:hypothetical protein
MIIGDVNMAVTSLGVKTSKRMVEYGLQRTNKTPLKTTSFFKGATDTNPLSRKKAYPTKQALKRLTSSNEVMTSEFATKADIDDAKIQILTWGTLFFIACTPMIIGILRYALS